MQMMTLLIAALVVGLLIIVGVAALVLFLVKRGKAAQVPQENKDYYQSSRQIKENLGTKLRKLFGGKTLGDTELEELEETLISADIGPVITTALIEKLRNKNITNIEDAIEFLKGELKLFFSESDFEMKSNELNIILILGVNGVGKTTSIAKLANYYSSRGLKVMLAAGDTFRAAATEQLTMWAERLSIPIVKQGEKADPASVVFDAMDSAIAKGVELLIVDTAGRLHNKKNLMEELKKIERIISGKGDFNKKNMLVIDSTTGQNAFIQAEAFHDAVQLDAITMTKYDAQSKGGIVFTIEKNLNIPFQFIGVGEKVEDLREFNKDDFVEKIFG